MLIRSLVYGLLITLLSSCLQTVIEQPRYDLKQLNDATPWKARGKMLVSTDSERQTLKFTWMHLSEDLDRIELRDAFGLQSVILVKELNEYYRENEKGQREYRYPPTHWRNRSLVCCRAYHLILRGF